MEIFARGPQIQNLNGIDQFSQALRQATNKKFKTIFLVSGNFSGKSRQCHIVVLRMNYKPTKFNEICGSHFLENQFFYIFSRELPLILGIGEKLKKKKTRDIYKRTLDIGFERDRSIGLGSTIGDGQTERQTHTHTHTHTHKHTHTLFSKTHFRLLE